MEQPVEPFKFPRPHPWLLLALLIVAAGVVFLRQRASRSVSTPDAAPAASAAPLRAPVPSPAPAPRPALAPASARVAPVGVARPAGQPSLAVAGAAGFAAARSRETAQDLAGAREAYLALLAQAIDPRVRGGVEAALGALNIRMLFSTADMPERTVYAVKKGDVLERIAKQFGSTVDLIQKSNGLARPDSLRIDQKLRVVKVPFTLEVSKGRNDMVVLLGGRFFKRYLVGTGKDGKTPVGTFVIWDKQKEPTWWYDGREIPFGHPDNLLGTRWMAIKSAGNTPPVSSYGVHGTWDEASIGKAESAGCIRMLNRDVEELYILLPIGTSITIRD